MRQAGNRHRTPVQLGMAGDDCSDAYRSGAGREFGTRLDSDVLPR